MRQPRKTAVGVTAALVVLAAAARADDPPVDAGKAQRLVDVAVKFRHDGLFDQAAAAYDQAVRLYPADSADRKTALLEAHELAVVESKFDRAARVAHGWDLDREAVALARDKKGELALKLARDGQSPLVEGRVLHALGRDAEAVAALEKAGVPGALDRGELLLLLNKPADAAKAFEDAGDPLRRALALERCKDASAAVVFEAARVEDTTRVESCVTNEKVARERQAQALSDLAKTRGRFAVADAEDELADACERLSIEHERTGDKAKAADLAQRSLDAVKAEREALIATDDKYGVALAKLRGLDAREKRLGDRVKMLRG